MHVQTCLSPDDIIGLGDLYFDRQLSSNPLLELNGWPAAGEQSLALSGRRAGNTDRGIKFLLGGGLEQERDHHDRERMTFLLPGFDLGMPKRADAGVQDVFEPLAGSGVGKDAAGQFVALQAAVRTDDFPAKGLFDFSQSRLAGLNYLPGQIVGVHHRHCPRAQQVGGGGLAHPDATG